MYKHKKGKGRFLVERDIVSISTKEGVFMLGRTKGRDAVHVQAAQQVQKIPINKILPNPYQPRKTFSQRGLAELAESIKEYGVLQPISVRKINSSTYELIAGERRLRASLIAGAKEIPALVTDINDEDSAIIALVENLQRENLGFLEEAEGYYSLLVDHGLTQEELAQRVGKSQSAVANKIRVLRLSGPVKKLIADYGLSERHARALLKLPNEELQLKVAKTVCDRDYNVKNTEELVKLTLERINKPGVDPILKKSDLEMAVDSRGRTKKVVKNIRIFVNTIKETINLLKLSGVDAKAAQFDRGDYFEFVVRIPKRANGIEAPMEEVQV